MQGKPSYVGDFRHVALALWDGMAELKSRSKPQALEPYGYRRTTAGLGKAGARLIVIAEPAAKALCDVLKIGSKLKGINVLDSPAAEVFSG